MTLMILPILLVVLMVLTAGHITNVNRAVGAMALGAVAWVLYICYGADFVAAVHPQEYADFLGGQADTSLAVKRFVASHIFVKCVGRAAEIVLFLVATMTIVDVLANNGCFDFITNWVKTRNARRLLWWLAVVTFLLSANLDNLTTATIMLVIMRRLLPNRRQRMIYGSAIVLAANCGGALTVIGDPIGLLLWNDGSVTPGDYSGAMALPCIVGCGLPIWWLGRQLPERIELQSTALAFRGNDTALERWQRLLMCVVGIGGLWSIPTFHNITQLSPFLGAMCVVAILWVVNEVVNRNVNEEVMTVRRVPHALQYGTISLILFILGIMLAVEVVKETGVLRYVVAGAPYINNVWLAGGVAGVLSSVLDNFAMALSLFTVSGQQCMANDMLWRVVAYSAVMGGNVLLLGSVSGLALKGIERIHIGWYFKSVGWMVIVAWLAGLAIMWVFSLL